MSESYTTICDYQSHQTPTTLPPHTVPRGYRPPRCHKATWRERVWSGGASGLVWRLAAALFFSTTTWFRWTKTAGGVIQLMAVGVVSFETFLRL